MATRIPALRHLACCAPRTRPWAFQQQQRWARVQDGRFLATKPPPPPPVADRYRARLEEKARQEGLESVDGLFSEEYLRRHAESCKKEAIEEPAAAAAAASVPSEAQPRRDAPPSSPPEPPKRRASPDSAKAPVIKSLGDILDLEKARALPERELTAIWRLRHANSPHHMCAVVPASTYRAMEEAARKAPQFVLPVPHESQGAEIHFLQWTFDAASKTSTVLFTHLAEYKSRGEFAQPHTTVTHHLDLAADKGLVLMQGQRMEDRGIRPQDAEWLVVCLQRFYGAWDGDELQSERRERAKQRRQLLEWFSAGDARFSVEKLMEEAERLG